jgi:hypothetical protein
MEICSSHSLDKLQTQTNCYDRRIHVAMANERADDLATDGMFKPGWRRYRTIPSTYLNANRRYVSEAAMEMAEAVRTAAERAAAA